MDAITDYAGNRYSFEYQHGKLITISFNGQPIARYTMRIGNNWLLNELIAMTDVEAGYTLSFTYTNHKVSSVEESAAGAAGSKLAISQTDDRRTLYRDFGQDRTSETADDILTYYGFDYAGRTVNAYTTDSTGNILGASNAAYSGTGSTDRTNNRTLRTAAIGVAAQQELRNFGFESTASDVAWQLHKSSGDSTATVNAVVNTDKPRTGSRSFKTWITPGKAGLTGAAKASNVLQTNTTYILSAYVNTSQAQAFSGKGIYLQATDSSGNTWKSPCVNYKTSALVDDGWVRVALTFQTKIKGIHTLAVYNDGVGGAIYADDMQLEWSRAPVSAAKTADTQAVSNVNLLENGSLQYWGYGWTMNSGASFASGVGVNSASDYAYSIRVTGNPKANHYASQTVPVNLPGSQTYVLSGWAKANSVPDNKLDGDPEKDKEAAAKDKNKQFGLRAVLTYAGGGTEYHYAAFNPELRDWQFTSLTIVPRQADKTVSYIRVECAYEKNANTAWFDDLSLVREAAQTMRYDEKGNLQSVATTGLKPDADTYQNGNLIRSVTGGYGTYTYTYDQTHKHRLKSVTDDVVTQTMDYDASGNVNATTLKSNTSSYLKTLHTAAAYTWNNNLVASVTDSSKQSEFYAYGDKQSVMTGQATSVRDADGNVTTTTYDTMGRVFKKGFVNSGRLNYNYREGLLTNVIRTDAAGNMQAFAYGHDGFGNLTGIMVGGVQLVSYQYGPKNGALQKQTYGNGDSVSFEYDNLGRITKSTYSSGRVLRYTYTGDGQLYSITDNGSSPGNSADDTIYSYTYDTLGRVINCQARRGIQTLLQTHWEYDDCNRVKSQGWQMGTSSYRETYTYSQKDGSLVSIDTEGGGNTLQFTYDPLQRLATAGNGVYTKNYTYRDISSAQTTSQVRRLQYSGLTGRLSGLSFHYTYNSMGNLASAAQGGDVPDTYTYDALGQLTQANCLYRGDLATYQYAYDSTGNLTRTSFYSPEYPDDQYTNTYRYSKYTWQDLLTEFNGEKLLYEGQSLSASGTVTGAPKSGKPVSYFNGTRWRFDWTEGRNLTQAEASSDSTDTALTFAYDLSGLRTDKRVVTKTYDTVLVHSYVTTVVAPTCTEGGYTLHSCDCGESYRTDTTAALGHSYVESGPDTYTCTRCGDTYSEHTHRYTATVVAPTCAEGGYTLHTCACGHTYRDRELAKLGHNYVKAGQSATHISYRCTRCGTWYSSPIITVPEEPKPPISEYSLDASSTGCASKRVLKSTETQEHSYLYAGDKLLRETITGNGPVKTLDFRYDNLGLPYSLTYQNGAAAPVTYYYITNLQGDVMYLVDSQGAQAAAYAYDPFGKTVSAEGPMAELNPLRYRGYYQDGETGFYYLQSRYYDPAICRFLNADSYASTGQSYLGYNAFAYCGNNPINRADADGEFWDIVFDVVSLGFSIADVIQNPSDPMAWAGLVGDVVDVAVPFVSGVGEATKAVGALGDAADVIDDAYDTVKAADNAIDAGKAANKVNLHKSYEWKKTRSNYWKGQAEIGGNDTWYDIYAHDNFRKMKKGKAPIGYDGEKVVLHHVRGIAKDINNFVEIGGSAHRAFHQAYGYKNYIDIYLV